MYWGLSKAIGGYNRRHEEAIESDVTYLNAPSHNVPRAATPTKLVRFLAKMKIEFHPKIQKALHTYHLTAPYPGVACPCVADGDPALELVVLSEEARSRLQLKAVAAADVPVLRRN